MEANSVLPGPDYVLESVNLAKNFLSWGYIENIPFILTAWQLWCTRLLPLTHRRAREQGEQNDVTRHNVEGPFEKDCGPAPTHHHYTCAPGARSSPPPLLPTSLLGGSQTHEKVCMRRGTAEEIWAVGTYLCCAMQCHTDIFYLAIFLLRPKLLSLGGTSLGQSGVLITWAWLRYQDGLYQTCKHALHHFFQPFFVEEPCIFSYSIATVIFVYSPVKSRLSFDSCFITSIFPVPFACSYKKKCAQIFFKLFTSFSNLFPTHWRTQLRNTALNYKTCIALFKTIEYSRPFF